MSLTTTLPCIVSLIVMSIPGFILIKTKMLKEKAIYFLSVILLYINQPAFTIHSFLSKEFEISILKNMGIVLVLGFVFHIITILISTSVFKIDKNVEKSKAYSFASSFGNIGFMGLPVVKFLIPNNPLVVIYLATMFVAFNLLTWTVGIYMLTGKKEYMSFKKAIFNPPTIAILIAIPLYLTNFMSLLPATVSNAILTPIGYLSEMIVPLSMLILGMRFATFKISTVFTDWELYLTSFVKLILTPFIALLIMKLLRIDIVVLKTLFIMMAMPSANMGLVLSEKFGGDKESAAKAILGTTLISVLTIPLVLLVL